MAPKNNYEDLQGHYAYLLGMNRPQNVFTDSSHNCEVCICQKIQFSLNFYALSIRILIHRQIRTSQYFWLF